MSQKLTTILQLLKIGIKSPLESIKKINFTNLKTLFHAISIGEPAQAVEDNFKTLLAPNLYPSKNKTIYLENHSKAISSELENKKTIKDNDINFSKKNIVIIGDLNLPQCKKYRVLQKIEIFKKLGYTCYFSHWEDTHRCMNFLQSASSVIFYRVSNKQIPILYLREAKRLNLKLGYDIDDPIFDREIYEKNENLNLLKENEKINLLNSTEKYLSFMNKCDFFISSTPGMVEAMKKHIQKPIFLWRNLVDSETTNAYTCAVNTTYESKEKKENFIISYMSGSRAHEADFNQASEAIKRILSENSFVKLYITGYADYGKLLEEQFPDQVTLFPFSDYYTYLASYAEPHVNIIPLVVDQFNECKSAIRMMEAALFEVPSMVSKVGDFVNIIESDINGIIIDSSTDWYTKLNEYINQKDRLRQIGKAAKKVVEEKLTVDKFCNEFPNELAAHL